MTNIDSLSKRLLSASMYNINFGYGDGHRWIFFGEESVADSTPLEEMLFNERIIPDSKIYGDIYEALDYIDSLLSELKLPSLEEKFDNYNNWFGNK